MTAEHYAEKFKELTQYPLYQSLPEDSREFIKVRAFAFHLTVQQFYEVVKHERDLQIQGEQRLAELWQHLDATPATRDDFLKTIRDHINTLRSSPVDFDNLAEPGAYPPSAQSAEVRPTDRKIYGDCPVASEATVCCNLKTIDAVENCPLGCSYCSIQTFYSDRFVFEERLAEKLRAIPIDPRRRYHFGTGQASDSLVWGNRHGMLEDLAGFARSNPNVLLELKTKTANVDELLSLDLPENLLVSWSLNPDTVIDKEEHFTASLDKRLHAARKVADAGVPIAFHFHPIIYYKGWESEYRELAGRVQQLFNPGQIRFISMGSLTLIKPVVKRIRELGFPTKMLQFPMDRDPHGKITYPEDLKITLFSTLYEAFNPWQDHVFFYLCMETAAIWRPVFGFCYETNEAFEQDFLDHLLPDHKSTTAE